MGEGNETATRETVRYVATEELRAEGDDTTCLRPLGLCELGGSCDVCWYRPDHPRFEGRSTTEGKRSSNG